MKKKSFVILSGVALLSLVGCGGTSTTSTPAASSSGVAASSSEQSSASSASLASKRAEMTLIKNEIPAGASFFDACHPTVIYHDGDTATDYTEYKNFVTYSVTNDDTSDVYEAGDALPAGKYTAKAVVKSKTAKAAFTVVAGNPIEASEGHGYQTVANFDKTAYQSKYPGMGALGAGKFPSVGSSKLIVIPVYFKDLATFTSDELATTNSAFFGEASETGWESLASYYKKSSYGKLNITGKVISPYQYPKATSTITSNDVSTILDNAIKQAVSNGEINRADYDTNGDGYLDGVEAVYKTDQSYDATEATKGSLWWNYTTVSGFSPSVSSPSLYRYFWSRFDYLATKYYTPDIDCHTMIHETGHMMGLNDYYSYDKNEGPAGCADMMDMNVGDHNAYSKMNYNWVTPKWIDGSADNFTLTLNSFTDTGDCAIIRNTTTDPWNQSQYDEYLILQYYTPTGVNKLDSSGYPEWKSDTGSMGRGGTYEKPGLQVFHVDSRNAAQFGTYTTDSTGKKTLSATTWKYTDHLYSDTVYNADGTFEETSQAIHDNTKSRSHDVVDGKLTALKDNINGKEIAAVLASGRNGLSGSTYYSSFGLQSNLFTTAEFGGASTTYSNFREREFFTNDLKWNDGSTFNWTFSVTNQTYDAKVAEGTNSGTITLHFVENA